MIEVRAFSQYENADQLTLSALDPIPLRHRTSCIKGSQQLLSSESSSSSANTTARLSSVAAVNKFFWHTGFKRLSNLLTDRSMQGGNNDVCRRQKWINLFDI